MRKSPMQRSILLLSFTSIFCAAILAHAQAAKPKLTLDEFFNSVSFDAVRVSPDGNSVVIGAERADWDQQIFRKELWLYRTASSSLVPLTQSGHDSAPQWSPDGQWIAFLSERKAEAADPDADEGKKKDRNKGGAQKGKNRDKDKDKDVAQLFLISPNGGEAIAITSGDEEVHAFAWSSDSKSIYFATRQPWTKDQTDEHKKDWKDTIRYRGDERGDQVFRLNVDEALARHAALGSKEAPEAEKNSGATPGAVAIARTPLHIDQLAITRDGQRLAFLTSSVSERQEKVEDVELFLVNLANGAATNPPAESAPIRLTRNAAVEIGMEWAPDNRHLFFQVNLGSAEGKYEDPQPRLYWVDAADVSNSKPETDASDKRQAQRWFADYPRRSRQLYVAARRLRALRLPQRNRNRVRLASESRSLHRQARRMARSLRASRRRARTKPRPKKSSRIAFAYSATQRPTEVYLAESSTNWRRLVPSRHSTRSSPNAIFPKPSPIAGPPMTARPSKAG